MRTVIIFCLCLSAFAAQAQNDVNYTYMDSLFQQLPEVLVKGERPVVKAERGKLVYDLPRMVERMRKLHFIQAVLGYHLAAKHIQSRKQPATS